MIVTVNGYAYRSTVAVMGGKYMISFSSDKRAATGIEGGDPIMVDLEVDTAPRTVEVPDDLAAALAAAHGAREAFDATRAERTEGARDHVEGAKAAETRERRIAKAVVALTAEPANADDASAALVARARGSGSGALAAPTRRMNALSWATPSGVRGSASMRAGE